MDKYLFVDAEADGLYGTLLSVACVVTDEQGNIISTFYEKVQLEIEDVKNDWVRENVLPFLGDCKSHENENSLLESFWKFYIEQGLCKCIADVPYPVEAGLFAKCVQMDLENRYYQGPFPLMDLSSMLYALNVDPLKERKNLINSKQYRLHNALDDVYMTIEIWKQYILLQK